MTTLSLWLLLASVLTIQAYAAQNDQDSNIFVAIDDAVEDRSRFARSADKESKSETDLEEGVGKRMVKRQNFENGPNFHDDGNVYPDSLRSKRGLFIYPPRSRSVGLDSSEEEDMLIAPERGFIYMPPGRPHDRPSSFDLDDLSDSSSESSEEYGASWPESSVSGDRGFIYMPPGRPPTVGSGSRGFIYMPPVRPPTAGNNERGFIYMPPGRPPTVGNNERGFIYMPPGRPPTVGNGERGFIYMPPRRPPTAVNGERGFIYMPPGRPPTVENGERGFIYMPPRRPPTVGNGERGFIYMPPGRPPTVGNGERGFILPSAGSGSRGFSFGRPPVYRRGLRSVSPGATASEQNAAGKETQLETTA